MIQPDDIAANLPPPRDDEPASLRRDIVDELADHLASAFDRERQREGTLPSLAGTTPWQRVLDRFGNPSALALRLWRDALQESLVMQRLASWVTIITMGAMSVGMFLIVRSVNEQQRAMIAQQRELAETLERLASRPAPEGSSIEWVPVEIRLSPADPAAKLAAGFKVVLSLLQNTSSVPPWEATTKDLPLVKFPLVRYGRYSLFIEAPWGEYLSREININPGTPVELTILCPSAQHPLVVRPEFVLPEDLKERRLHVLFDVGAWKRECGGATWQTFSRLSKRTNGPSVLLGTDGRLRPLSSDAYQELQDYLVYDDQGDLEGIRWADAALVPQTSLVFHLERGERESSGLFLFKERFETGRDVLVEVSGTDRRLTIRPTEKGIEKLRAILKKLDQVETFPLEGTPFAAWYGSGVPLSPFPEHRP